MLKNKSELFEIQVLIRSLMFAVLGVILHFYLCKPNHNLELILRLYAHWQQTDHIDVGTQGEGKSYLKNTIIGINM